MLQALASQGLHDTICAVGRARASAPVELRALARLGYKLPGAGRDGPASSTETRPNVHASAHSTHKPVTLDVARDHDGAAAPSEGATVTPGPAAGPAGTQAASRNSRPRAAPGHPRLRPAPGPLQSPTTKPPKLYGPGSPTGDSGPPASGSRKGQAVQLWPTSPRVRIAQQRSCRQMM
jgi:hypothetical protein